MKKSIEIIKGSNQKKILMDITFPKKSNNKLIIFSHGFKGFKDWGCFNLISKIFAENGFTFLKFNFSHNGTTIADPLNFNDLEGNLNLTCFDTLFCSIILSYAPQDTILPLTKNGNTLSISAGGTISNNHYAWYKDGVLEQTPLSQLLDHRFPNFDLYLF